MSRPILLAIGFAIAVASASGQRLEERITVERIIIDARVTDDRGDPVLNLKPADFRVRIDGKNAEVESVDWIPDTAAARESAEAIQGQETAAAPPPPTGRLLVIFVQTDFQRASQRIAGQLQFLPFLHDFVDSLEPEDRVAVLSFDSHLKFRLDFSNDHRKINEAIDSTVPIDDPPWPALAHSPALGSHLNEKAARDAASSETALFLVGNALRQIPGAKSLILVGWGLGRYGGGTVSMTRDYTLARRTLEAARTSIFVLDITQADYHSLELGLGKAAGDTGGTYAKTFNFPSMAIGRLQRTLSGHYELTLHKPPGLATGEHAVEVELRNNRRAWVMARSGYTDKQ